MDYPTYYGHPSTAAEATSAFEKKHFKKQDELIQLLKEHRAALYEEVRHMRRFSEQEKRYPWKMPFWKQLHDGDTDEDFVQRYNSTVESGLWVHSKVEWLVPFEEVEFEWETKKKEDLDEDELKQLWPGQTELQVRKKKGWYKTLGDSTGVVPENPLLAITVTPAWGHIFPVKQYRYEGQPWHISLAKYWSLGPDIYDKGNIMEHLLAQFHDKDLLLTLDPLHQGDQWFDKKEKVWKKGLATGMTLDPDHDIIATDEWANRARNMGSYGNGNRDWHISL
jgi:hypothetical protein